MRTRPDRTLKLLLAMLALGGSTRLSAQVEPRPSIELLFPTSPRSLHVRSADPSLDFARQEAREEARSDSKASWAVVGFLGSVAGGWSGAHAGGRLGLLDDPSSEDPELPSVIVGAVVGSTLGAAVVVAAVDGRDGSFPGALGGALVGTLVGLAAVGMLNESAGLVAFSVTQTLGAVLGASGTD